MVHNGIEYALMAAYAEGLNILKHAGVGREDREIDAETAPLGNPEHYQYDIDLPRVAEVWRRGSVVASWLLDLTVNALHQDPWLSLGNKPATGYETLIYDCMNGDATLYKHADTVEKGWEIVQSVMDVWAALPPREFPNYVAGTWGPTAAGTLLKNDARLWRRIKSPS